MVKRKENKEKKMRIINQKSMMIIIIVYMIFIYKINGMKRVFNHFATITFFCI